MHTALCRERLTNFIRVHQPLNAAIQPLHSVESQPVYHAAASPIVIQRRQDSYSFLN